MPGASFSEGYFFSAGFSAGFAAWSIGGCPSLDGGTIPLIRM